MRVRLQKFLADSGIASRRKAEELIVAGKIYVNGERKTTLGAKIDPDKDVVEFNHEKVAPQAHVYIMLNKPKGITSTTRHFKTEKNILAIVNRKEKIFPVGRLDKGSEGLMFLTNDGEWANKISHPKYQIEKEYEVKVKNPVSKKEVEQMKKGIFDKNEFLQVKKYILHSPTSLTLILTQGHKREIRRLFSYFNNHIISLKRIRIGKWKIEDLKLGEYKVFNP